MKSVWVTLDSEPERKLRRLRMIALLPLMLVPARPGMLSLLIALVDIGAKDVSPPTALGIVVATAPEPPISYASECPLRISPPVLKACLPFVQLRLSPYVHKTVVSRYEVVLPPPMIWFVWKLAAFGNAVGVVTPVPKAGTTG